MVLKKKKTRKVVYRFTEGMRICCVIYFLKLTCKVALSQQQRLIIIQVSASTVKSIIYKNLNRFKVG